MLQSGILPSAWKCSKIIPIPNTSPSSSLPSDNRPISLLSIISKLLERHVFNILLDICLDNNLISDFQFGFLPNRSTSSALLYATHFISSSLNSHLSVCGIFLDLKKAFDSVPHQPLIDVLSSLNIPSFLVDWIHSYLTSHSQFVYINGSFSHKSPVHSGVPQGSILGPLLFLLYINKIGQTKISPHSKLVVFADDILLLHTINSPTDFSSVQSDLNSIVSTIASIHLTINPAKSKYMIFSLLPHILNSPTPDILNSSLERVNNFRYLGLLFSPKLSWSDHIQVCTKKARRLIGLIYRHFYNCCSSKSLLSLYLSIVHPILEYCSVVWDPSSTYSSILESTQFFALKVISKSWSSYSHLLHTLKIDRLSSRRKHKKLLTIQNNFLFISEPPLLPTSPSHYNLRSFNQNNLNPITSVLSMFENSFFPSSIKLWNSLPDKTKSTFHL